MADRESQTDHIQLSYFRYALAVAALVAFEYMALKIISMPYSELEQNADRFHPLMAYLFFIPIIPLVAAAILSLLLFLFSKNKGLVICADGIVDNSSMFSIGYIPFDQISSMTNDLNLSVGVGIIKSKRNAISINLRNRKIDHEWWSNKGWKGRLIKKRRNYQIQTSHLANSHDKIVESIKFHIGNRGIKFNTINFER